MLPGDIAYYDLTSHPQKWVVLLVFTGVANNVLTFLQNKKGLGEGHVAEQVTGCPTIADNQMTSQDPKADFSRQLREG